MSNFAAELKNEVSRLAKKEIRHDTAAMKKASSQHRTDIAALKRRVAALESLVNKLHRKTGKSSPTVAVEERENLRFRAGGFASLRKKLDLTAAEMGKLLGVTGQSVYKWEQGKAKPRASQLKVIAAVRKMGKRDVTERLAQA